MISSKNHISIITISFLFLFSIFCLSVENAESNDSVRQDYIVIKDDNSVSLEKLYSQQAKRVSKDEAVECVEKDKNIVCDEHAEAIIRSEDKNWPKKVINDVNDGNNGQGVKIAIIDSGVDYDENIAVEERIDFLKADENDVEENIVLNDSFGHGTAIASIIAGKGSNGKIKGIANNSKVYSLRVIDADQTASISAVVQSIYWAIDNNVDIINMSFGVDSSSKALKQAIQDASNNGIILIAAAGNTPNSNVEYPAAYKNVISVGSVNAMSELSKFNPRTSEIDIFAPGEAVNAQTNFGEEMITNGTSISTAYVTAAFAKLLSIDSEKDPEFIKKAVLRGVKNVDPRLSSGLIDYKYSVDIYNNANIEDASIEDEIIDDMSGNNPYVEQDLGIKVTARWDKETHTKHSANAAMKEGAFYPDQHDYIKGMTSHPTMHGYSWRTNDTLFNKGSVNYIANYRYLIKVADAVGKGKSYTTVKRSNIAGMTEKDFKELTNILNTLVGKKTYKNKSASNKKAFIMGLAMHTATDSFAHSAFQYVGYASWKRIKHPNADNNKVHPKRREMALAVENNVVSRYQGKRNGTAIAHDFYSEKMNGSYKFAINKMYSFAKDAGVTSKNVLGGYSTVSKKKSL